jgi:dTDP-4-amino-4,6-dideoxygalactose transaminase
LSDVPGLAFQTVPWQQTANAWYLFLGRIDAAKMGCTRDEFHAALKAKGVPCTPFYPHPLYGNPLYEQGGCRVEPCPVSEACIKDAFWLSHRVLLGDEQTTREVAAAIRSVASQ